MRSKKGITREKLEKTDLVSFSRSFSSDGHVSRRVGGVLEVLLPIDGLGVRHLSFDAICKQRKKLKCF